MPNTLTRSIFLVQGREGVPSSRDGPLLVASRGCLFRDALGSEKRKPSLTLQGKYVAMGQRWNESQ